MKRISIQQPIIDAVDESDASMARFQNQMMKWAKHIERSIGSKLGYKYKAKKFTVDGCSITLPDDCLHVVMVLPGDYENECNARYQSIEWLNIRTDEEDHEDDYYSWLWRPAETMYANPYLWEQIADELHMILEYVDTEMTLIYQFIETDNNGFWIINESHSDAITKFILYKTARKLNWKINKSDKMLRTSHLQFTRELEREYNVAIRNARAEDGETSPFEQKQY